MQPNDDLWLTYDEVSKKARTPKGTLQNLRSQGRGPRGARVGRRVLFRASDVTKWLESHLDEDPRPAA